MVKLRKWLRILHRDIGYIAAGLTVIYAISGVAVNHVDVWNPNYKVDIISSQIKPLEDSLFSAEKTAAYVMRQLNDNSKIKSYFRPDPETFQIFAEGNTLTVDLNTWSVDQEKVKSRFLIRETNFLHLNAPKKLWTWVADIFAIALAFLAISGLFMIKGKKGITGRGAWLTALGILIPLVFLFWYYW